MIWDQATVQVDVPLVGEHIKNVLETTPNYTVPRNSSKLSPTQNHIDKPELAPESLGGGGGWLRRAEGIAFWPVAEASSFPTKRSQIPKA